MVGDPISERIIENVVETLGQVRQASGYYNDFIVEREKQDGNSPRDNLIVVMMGDPQPQKGPMGFSEWLMPVGMIYYAIESESSPVVISTRLQRGAADIRKALCEDLHRGALAINTELDVEKDDYLTTVSPFSVTVKAFIRFRTLWNNPYKQY